MFFSAPPPTLSPSTRSRAVSPARSLARPLAADTRTLASSSRASHPERVIPPSRHDGARAEEKSKSGGKKRRRRRLSAARLGRRGEEGITTITGESDDDAEMMDEDGGGGDGCVSVVAAPFGPRSSFFAGAPPPPTATRSSTRPLPPLARRVDDSIITICQSLTPRRLKRHTYGALPLSGPVDARASRIGSLDLTIDPSPLFAAIPPNPTPEDTDTRRSTPDHSRSSPIRASSTRPLIELPLVWRPGVDGMDADEEPSTASRRRLPARVAAEWPCLSRRRERRSSGEPNALPARPRRRRHAGGRARTQRGRSARDAPQETRRDPKKKPVAPRRERVGVGIGTDDSDSDSDADAALHRARGAPLRVQDRHHGAVNRGAWRRRAPRGRRARRDVVRGWHRPGVGPEPQLAELASAEAEDRRRRRARARRGGSRRARLLPGLDEAADRASAEGDRRGQPAYSRLGPGERRAGGE